MQVFFFDHGIYGFSNWLSLGLGLYVLGKGIKNVIACARGNPPVNMLKGPWFWVATVVVVGLGCGLTGMGFALPRSLAIGEGSVEVRYLWPRPATRLPLAELENQRIFRGRAKSRWGQSMSWWSLNALHKGEEIELAYSLQFQEIRAVGECLQREGKQKVLGL